MIFNFELITKGNLKLLFKIINNIFATQFDQLTSDHMAGATSLIVNGQNTIPKQTNKKQFDFSFKLITKWNKLTTELNPKVRVE